VVLGEVKGHKGCQHSEPHDDKRDNDVEADVKVRQIPDFFQVPFDHFASVSMVSSWPERSCSLTYNFGDKILLNIFATETLRTQRNYYFFVCRETAANENQRLH
jgi:hypothetical protein